MNQHFGALDLLAAQKKEARNHQQTDPLNGTLVKPEYLYNRSNLLKGVLERERSVNLALYMEEPDEWHIHLQDLPPADDLDLWKQAITNMMNLDPVNVQWRCTAGPQIPDACGFSAIQFLTSQMQGEWLWEPLQANTGDINIDGRIFAHLQNLRQFLLAHRAPTYYVRQILQLRASFLTSLHDAAVNRN